MEGAEELLKQLEPVIRGKRVDTTSLLNQAKELFLWAQAGATSVDVSNEDARLRYVNSAVVLYNKAKSIVPKHLSEVKTYTKGAAAWMLSAFCENKLKTVIICVKIHSRCGAEFLQIPMLEDASKHFAEAIRYWNRVNIAALERVLSPIEIEEIRNLMFGTLVDYAKLCRKNGCEADSVRPVIGAAMEIIQTLPNVRLQFITHLLDIGYEYANEKQYMDGLHYFRIGLTVAELPITQTQERKQLQLKLHLGCCFCYKELDDCDKALLHLHEAEALAAPMETTLFAHFSIHLRAGDVVQAGNYLLQLIRATHSYALVLNAVMMYTEYAEVVGTIQDLFDALLQRFHQEPECTSTKICQLQWMLSSNHWLGSDLEKQSRLLLEDLVASHISRPLNDKNFTRLLSIIYNHISRLHAEEQFCHIAAYAATFIPVLSLSTDYTHYCNVTLYYVDALVHTENFEEAFTVSQKLLTVCKTTPALLLHFKAALAHHQKPLEAAESILTYVDPDPVISLEQILQCSQLTREVSTQDNYPALELLLSEYLRRFALNNMWELDSAPVTSYQKVLCSLIHESVLTCAVLTTALKTDEPKSTKRLADELTINGEKTKKLRLDPDERSMDGDDEGMIGELTPCEKVSFSTRDETNLADQNSNKEAEGFMLRGSYDVTPHEIKIRILDPLRLYLQLAYQHLSLQKQHDLENKWLADVAWNVGSMLMKTGNDMESDGVHEKALNKGVYLSYWCLAADFFETAQQIYVFVDTCGDGALALTSADNIRLQCLLTATSLRLDAQNIFDEDNFGLTYAEDGSSKDTPNRENNINAAHKNLEAAALLTTPSNPQLLTLRLAYYCATSIPETFIDDNTHGFLHMSLEQMQRCVDTILSERVTALACRQLLQVAIQCAFRDTIPCYQTIGKYYSKLINLSPTRQEALQKVEEFEQLVRKESNFDAEDINYICCMCYNWGVTLIQLEQIVLAEKFISKALNLYHYTSQDFAIWNETIQEAYLHILKLKSKSDNAINIASTGDLADTVTEDVTGSDFVSAGQSLVGKGDMTLSLNVLGI